MSALAFRVAGLGLLLFASIVGSLAGDSFSLYVPDSKGRSLLSLELSLDGGKAKLSQGSVLGLPFAPSGLAAHPDGSRLIVTGGGEETPVATVKMSEDGSLALIGSRTLKAPGGYTSVDRSGRFFLMANYRTGTLSVFGLEREGAVGAMTQSVMAPTREAHCILTTLDNRFVYVPCVKNNNALYQYSFDDEAGRLVALMPFDAEPPAMFGPRHVAYHPRLSIAYFSNEQQLGVSVYEIGKEGQLKDRQHAITMSRRSPYVQGERDMHASDLVVSPDGKRLYVAVRDFVGDEDSVFSFGIEEDGRLRPLARTKVGDIPWKVDLSPNGSYLVVSEWGDARIAVFKIAGSGELSEVAAWETSAGVRDMVVSDELS